jgi:hypothetical protein
MAPIKLLNKIYSFRLKGNIISTHKLCIYSNHLPPLDLKPLLNIREDTTLKSEDTTLKSEDTTLKSEDTTLKSFLESPEH